ncbi:MAG TPA: nucleoside triphosphate pyrophosphohydrolase [Spirochaetia bacterium]|nr:nucleoside triphosphate pyrophosphohydrolase [Spirochaetia bacterium]
METLPQDAFLRLLGIVQRLRAPNGCPWDLEQTPSTLRASVVEEAWECVSAIDSGDEENLAEELGDLYLMATMVSWMKEQEGTFSVSAVLQGISDKLVRRHPHVFGEAVASTPEAVLEQWAAIKATEKPRPTSQTSALDGVPGSLPPLERAFEVQKKAAKVGFDWPGPKPVWEKLEEETAELREARESGSDAAVESELGDLLFTVVNLSRLLGVDPSVALNRANDKFSRRFRQVEDRLRAQGSAPKEAGLERMDAIWNQVKAEEAGSQPLAASGDAPEDTGGSPATPSTSK